MVSFLSVTVRIILRYFDKSWVLSYQRQCTFVTDLSQIKSQIIINEGFSIQLICFITLVGWWRLDIREDFHSKTTFCHFTLIKVIWWLKKIIAGACRISHLDWYWQINFSTSGKITKLKQRTSRVFFYFIEVLNTRLNVKRHESKQNLLDFRIRLKCDRRFVDPDRSSHIKLRYCICRICHSQTNGDNFCYHYRWDSQSEPWLEAT